MWTLGIDTSGRAGSVALLRDESILEERELSAAGRRHARTLIPEIGDLLRRQSLTPQDVNIVAVSTGPGSFTGLRVGVVCAKTLAYALPAVKLVGIDTFLAVAEGAPHEIERLAIVEDALRDDVFAGIYHKVNSCWTTQHPPMLMPFQAWKQSLPSGISLAGPGLEKFHNELSRTFHLVPSTCWRPQACHVAALGIRQARMGHVADLWTLEPFYIRRSAAEEKADASRAR